MSSKYHMFGLPIHSFSVLMRSSTPCRKKKRKHKKEQSSDESGDEEEEKRKKKKKTKREEDGSPAPAEKTEPVVKESKDKPSKKSNENGWGNGKPKDVVTVVDLEEELNLEELMKQKVSPTNILFLFLFISVFFYLNLKELLQARLGAYESSGEEPEVKEVPNTKRNDKSKHDDVTAEEPRKEIRREKERDREHDRHRERDRDREKEKEKVSVFLFFQLFKMERVNLRTCLLLLASRKGT